MILKNCPICGSVSFSKTGKPYGHSEDSQFDEIQCKECKLRWVEPMPTEEEIDEYYKNYYKRRRNTGKLNCQETNESKIYRFITMKKYRNTRYIKKLNQYTGKGFFVDFGCGEGELLIIAKERGWDVLGIEYSVEIKDELEKLEINVVNTNSLSNASLKEKSIYCISSTHVIEHIINHTKFFSDVKKYLKPEGIFATKVPSATSLRAKLNLSYWHLTYPYEHFWGFDINNYRMLLENNGFDILYIKDSLIIDELTCIAKIRKA
ncbi:MAG: class I SAM-dependent methyltransferase [Ignavibacteria bacterium]|nr:class I SAM-dependent methyltransferase [Ignavibacteria bacterium]